MNLCRSAALLVALVLSCAAPAGAQVNPFGDTLDLEPADIEMMKAAAAELFTDDAARLGDTRTWSNPDSGNAGSVGVHRSLGFEMAGVLRGAGFKHGRWVDVVMMRLELNGGDATAPVGDGWAFGG